jgi:hypothetical protein
MPSLSNRGDRVAVYWNRDKQRGLWLLSWPGREERFVALDLQPIGWSADDRWIYAQSLSGRTVSRVSPEDGKVEPLSSFSVGTLDGSCTLTPDAAAVICPLLELNTDVWLMEDFDPAVRTRTR